MNKRSIGAGLLLVATTAFVFGESQQALIREAKVDRMHAEKTAIASAHGGTIKSCEVEREHGKLIWSCDIAKANANGITEVAVDAKTGKVVSVKQESAAEEAKEAKADAKEKKPRR